MRTLERAHDSSGAPEGTKSVARALGAERSGPARLRPTITQTADAVHLQPKVGNAAVGSLVRAGLPVQAKLVLGQPDDQYEREADRVAAAVMRSTDGSAAPVSLSWSSPVARRLRNSELDRAVQASSAPDTSAELTPTVESHIARARGGGRPLDRSTRSFFEPRFGRDLSSVMVHDDAAAVDSARAISAHAYTVGGDIFFGAGKYSPATSAGRGLLAHELVHTVQQGATASPIRGNSSEDPLSSHANNARAASPRILRQGVGSSPVAAPVTAPPAVDPITGLPWDQLLPQALEEIPNLSTLLRLGPLESQGPPWLERQREPGRGEETGTRPGKGADLAAAVAGIPGVDSALDSAKTTLVSDWTRLSTGGKWVVGAVGGVVTSSLLLQEDVRSALDGRRVPKPATGSPWIDNLDLVLHTREGGLGVGLQLNLVGLFRSRSEAKVQRRSGGGTDVVQRQPAPGTATTSTASDNQTEASSSAGSGRRLWSSLLVTLDRIAREGTPRRIPKSEGMTGVQAWEVTVSVEQALDLTRLAGATPPGSSQSGRQAPTFESATVIYTNDGRGPFVNIGGGSDQELTTSVHVRFKFANEGQGWTSGGYNLEIWTPLKGGPATPLPGYPPGLYPGQPGPQSGGYKGLIYADFVYRLSGTGKRDLSLLTKAGANSTPLGDSVQTDWVHTPLGIAHFDWKHEPTEPYAALGLRAQTVLDLIGNESLGDSEFRMQLTLSSQAAMGTHDTEAGGSAVLSLKSGFVRLGGPTRAALELRFGADGRGLIRYNDQVAARVGLEAGVSNEIRIDLRDVDLPLVPPFDVILFAGGRSQQSTLPESRASPGEDRPGGTGAWFGPGSKTQGSIGIEVPLR